MDPAIEQFDICGPGGEPAGRIASRQQVHREGLWHRSVHLWLVNDRGELLLQQRHPSKQTDPGRWDIAVAGHLAAGQTPLEALVREAGEELGLVLDPASLVFLGARPQEYIETGYIDREWQHQFAGRWNGGLASLVLQPDEVVAVRWLAVDAYRRALHALDLAYVDRRSDWAGFVRWWSSSPSS